MSKIGGYFKGMIKSWLNIQEAGSNSYTINEKLDFDGTAIRNRIWYRGDPYELNQFCKQLGKEDASFWSMVPESGTNVRKIHSGLPSLIVDVISNIVIRDMGDIKVEHKQAEWDAIAMDNKFNKILSKALRETMYIGDGAIKFSFDKNISDYPIIEYYPGDEVEFVFNRGRYVETVFKNIHKHNEKTYVHYERYGFGYIKNTLKEISINELLDLGAIPQTANIIDVCFAGYKEDADGYCISKGLLNMAIPVKIFESPKFSNRGRSIFESKISSFDAFDEVISQWLDAVRTGRAVKYVPESMIPRDKKTGKLFKPNDFDHKFIEVKGSISEKDSDKISIEQPTIPTENYLQSYITYLDLCLQGVISPSTLGIDTKKLDNAEAQREKEKTTLYTRGIIVNMIQELVPQIVNVAIKTLEVMNNKNISDDVDVSIAFGEYANPSFEAVVETMSKARPGQPVMSIEAIVEELYGESKDDKWKKTEVMRLKSEDGTSVVDEPGMNQEDVIDEENNLIN